MFLVIIKPFYINVCFKGVKWSIDISLMNIFITLKYYKNPFQLYNFWRAVFCKGQKSKLCHYLNTVSGALSSAPHYCQKLWV